nr:MAG TPA: hypothetical protein [Bacteriophage sp.]
MSRHLPPVPVGAGKGGFVVCQRSWRLLRTAWNRL